MAKTLVASDELRRLMLAEIKKNDGCEDVTGVSVYRVIDDRAENNWSVGVVGCGSAAPKIAYGAAINAQNLLGREYDLLEE